MTLLASILLRVCFCLTVMAAEGETSTVCGLPPWLQIPNNDTSSFITNVVLGAINVPFCVFAFLGNLIVVIAVIKTPSLRRPSNILLCSLATTDCLTGLVAQPIFVAWRLMIHRIHKSCDNQFELFRAFIVSQSVFTGWSFANLAIMSCYRHYALAKPLVYRTNVTNKGKCRSIEEKILVVIYATRPLRKI